MIKELILGSTSPRRKEILSFFSYPFVQVSPDFDEESVPFDNNPEEYAKEISLGKAKSLKAKYPNDIVITADTVVYKAGKHYLKPNDEAHALQMLTELSNGWHSVYTAITLQKGSYSKSEVEETRVLVNPLTQDQIMSYLKTLPYLDKAGGYFIQTSGSLLARSIHGCFYNVMGLPINLLQRMLLDVDIDLWNYLRA